VPRDGAEESAAPVDGQAALSATATDDTVVVLDRPRGRETHRFDNPTETGVPLTFMVVGASHGWVEVQLPVRPNGSTGWVEEEDVDLATIPYELRVSTTENELTLLEDGKVVSRFDAATGTGQTPTPTGRYYLTELIEPTNPGYGDYAYGVSAFSDVLNEFGGGPGQIGLHGTTEVDTIGESVSHGCIRLSNEDITALTTLLPLGTPIEIT